MRATFMPCARRIYARTFRVISGFGPHGVLAQMRAPRMRRLSAACSSGRHFAYSFLQAPPRGECLTLAVRLTVPITRARRGLPPPSHRLVRSFHLVEGETGGDLRVAGENRFQKVSM